MRDSPSRLAMCPVCHASASIRMRRSVLRHPGGPWSRSRSPSIAASSQAICPWPSGMAVKIMWARRGCSAISASRFPWAVRAPSIVQCAKAREELTGLEQGSWSAADRASTIPLRPRRPRPPDRAQRMRDRLQESPAVFVATTSGARLPSRADSRLPVPAGPPGLAVVPPNRA